MKFQLSEIEYEVVGYWNSSNNTVYPSTPIEISQCTTLITAIKAGDVNSVGELLTLGVSLDIYRQPSTDSGQATEFASTIKSWSVDCPISGHRLSHYAVSLARDIQAGTVDWDKAANYYLIAAILALFEKSWLSNLQARYPEVESLDSVILSMSAECVQARQMKNSYRLKSAVFGNIKDFSQSEWNEAHFKTNISFFLLGILSLFPVFRAEAGKDPFAQWLSFASSLINKADSYFPYYVFTEQIAKLWAPFIIANPAPTEFATNRSNALLPDADGFFLRRTLNKSFSVGWLFDRASGENGYTPEYTMVMKCLHRALILYSIVFGLRKHAVTVLQNDIDGYNTPTDLWNRIDKIRPNKPESAIAAEAFQTIGSIMGSLFNQESATEQLLRKNADRWSIGTPKGYALASEYADYFNFFTPRHVTIAAKQSQFHRLLDYIGDDKLSLLLGGLESKQQRKKEPYK